MARKPPSQRFLPNREKRGVGGDSDGGGVSDRREAKEGTNPNDPQDDLAKGRTSTPFDKSKKGKGKVKTPITKTWEKVSLTGLPEQVAPRARAAIHASIPGQKAPRKPSKGIPFATQFPGHPRSRGGK